MGNICTCTCREEDKTVFKSGEKVYRIPALFYDRDRKFLMAFAESRKTFADTSTEKLVMKTGTVTKYKCTHQVTIKWSEQKLVEEALLEGHRPMNPCPVYDKTKKTLFLFFTCVKGTVSEQQQIKDRKNQTRLCYVKTTDGGETWSSVTDLTESLDEIKKWATFGVGPGHGIQTESGRLIVPVYAYACNSGNCYTPYALALHSDDKGSKWQFGNMLKNESHECEMAEFFDGSDSVIYCNARSKVGYRAEALSKNQGDDFERLSPVRLVETGSGCQGSLVSFPAQSDAAHADNDQSESHNKWLLYSHPSNSSKRSDLAVYLNKSPKDPMDAWSEPWIINKGPSGYSDLAYIDDGWFACLLECGKKFETEQIASKVFSYSQCEPKKEDNTVFKSGEKVYRIPALFYDRDRKILMAFAERRTTSDDASAEKLVMKTGTVTKDKDTHQVTIKWSEQKLVEEALLKGHRPMNPCPVYEKTSKTLFLFFISVESTVSEQRQIQQGTNKTRLCYVTTTDAGETWISMTDLTESLDEIKKWATFGVGPGHGIQTESGRLIVPVYAYACNSGNCYTPYALSLFSDDNGSKWQFGNMLKNKSLECEMAEIFDGTDRVIYCNARTEGGCREEALSKNQGKDFEEVKRAEKFVETGKGCQGSVVSFPDQSEAAHADNDQSEGHNKWLLYSHPSNSSERSDLAVYLNKSPKDPSAWSEPWIINKGPSGYSDLAYIDDGWFACLLECGKDKETEQIAWKVFSYSDVPKAIEVKKENRIIISVSMMMIFFVYFIIFFGVFT